MNKETRVITQEEFELIINTIMEGYESNGVVHRPNPKLATILICEANVGCRISDILLLTLESFEMIGNRCIIDIHEKKTGKRRKFSCNVQFYNFLLEYCMKNGITNKKRRIFDIGERAIQKSLKEVADYLGLEKIGSHSFRKFYATAIYCASNYNIAYVQRILLHSSPQTTLRYIGMEESELERILQETVNIPVVNH